MSGREVMAVSTYLIHFRDAKLALAVGAALEGRLAADGRDAVALVPAGDGLGLTRAAGGRRAGRGSYRAAPEVVALYEDGLLEQLEALGVTAYVGVGPEHEPSVARWGDGGAMLLPVATARELVDAVADHSPWAVHAAGMTPLDGLDGGLTGPATPGLTRTLAVAGIAGPLLLAGLPGVASAATTPASHHPAGVRARVTAVDTSLFKAKPAPPVPASTRAFLNQIERSLRFYLQELRQTSTTNTAGMQALENQIMRLINAAANAQPRTTTQPAPQQGGGSAGGGGQAPSNAGSQNGSGGQGQQSAGGQGGQGQGQQGQGQQSQAPQNQGMNQGQQDQSQQNGQDQNQQDPNNSQGSSTSQGPSASQGSMSGQGNSGQGNSGQGMSGQGMSGQGKSGQGTSGQGMSGQGTSGSGLGTTASGGNSGWGSSASGGGYSGGGSSGGNSGGGGSSGGNSGGGSSGGGSA